MRALLKTARRRLGSSRLPAWLLVVSALALALYPSWSSAPNVRAQSSGTTGSLVVTPPNGNPFVALPKPCWPAHLLTGRDTAFRILPCNSLDVLPVGMRVQVDCTLDKLQAGGWDPLVFETVRGPPRQDWLYRRGRDGAGFIVTNVQDARLGFHYWGWAVDIIHRTKKWDHPRFFLWLARHAESCGLVAGGFWKRLRDWPHIQFAAIESMSRAPAIARRFMIEDKRDSLWAWAGAIP